MSKKFLPNIGLLIAVIVIGLLTIELGLRLAGIRPTNPPLLYQKAENPLLSYELEPNIRVKAFRNIVTVNSLGFRSPEIKEGLPLIAILGDSVIFGYGVSDSETLPAQLKTLLPRYNVLNAGVPGYNIAQEAVTYREKIAALDPSLLILVFSFNDVTPATAFLDESGVLRPEGWDGIQCTLPENILGVLPGACFLDQHSSLYRATKNMINTLQGFQAREEKREQEQTRSSTDPVTDEDIAFYVRHLEELASPLPDSLPRLFVIWPEDHLHVTSRRALRRLAEDNGFVVLDLYDHFGNTPETLSWDYSHPSPKTLKEAANLILDALTSKNLLPS